MKLKGLVWFFTISLILISLWELSYTWVVRSYENGVKSQAERIVKRDAPNLAAISDAYKAAVKNVKDSILNATRDKSIFPVVGTTYQKCKEQELNLGLDLQGGLSVTMDVSLDDLVVSLSNNPKDSPLLRAVNTAHIEKTQSNTDFITLFKKAYIAQNGANKLSGLFAGQGKDIKISDNDDQVAEKLSVKAKSAIQETYKILLKRIDKFGVAQPNINFDENRGIITVELAGVENPDRVKKLLSASAHLQFWEVYMGNELTQSINAADVALQGYLNGISTVDTNKTKPIDSAKSEQNANVLAKLLFARQTFPSAIGTLLAKDTATFFRYVNNEVVKSAFPPNIKFLLGNEEKSDDKGTLRYFPVYAVKTVPGSEAAPIEGDAIDNAAFDYDQNGKPAVRLIMTSYGRGVWAKLTEKNVGRPIAIALDDIVYSAPNVINAITDGTSIISGSMTADDVTDLTNTLNSGKVSTPAKIVADQVVGATLGEKSITGGMWSFGISFLVIFLLMLVYYNTAGWIANIALILNLLFTIGTLTAFGATLTAAGIAGLVLTIGMAVDTNVIIFERIKEELTKGKSYQQSVNDGYRRSLAPVLDAHVTTFLTAMILFFFGLGPVLGFATTQMLGIVLSLFCGILVSRLITDVWTNKQRHFNYFTGISKRIFKHANFKFIEYRKVAYGISVVVLLAGIGAFFNGFHEGVEFKGGRSYTVRFDREVKNDDIRDDLKNAFAGDYPVIKTVGNSRTLDITTSYLIGQDNADSTVRAHLFAGLKKVLPANLLLEDFVKQDPVKPSIQSYTTIQPSISEDLKKGAVKATVFAILIIFIYIFVRFRDWRYSMGTIVALLHDVLVTLAVFSFFKNIVPFPLEIDQHFIAAVLTVIGFSMNDTVIVFDRIREYSKGSKADQKGSIINRAINDTLSRTIMTSLTVFLTLLILFIFGGEVTRGFAFAMLIGVITGTYSSIFVAAPILVDFAKDKPLGEAELISTHHEEKAVAKKV
ncbi:MAG: protein translocase subunit SecDF [Bacteroidetes bacterium]|nr:protein translocase subunit SecDF [Bacteroidota bacterium]